MAILSRLKEIHNNINELRSERLLNEKLNKKTNDLSEQHKLEKELREENEDKIIFYLYPHIFKHDVRRLKKRKNPNVYTLKAVLDNLIIIE